MNRTALISLTALALAAPAAAQGLGRTAVPAPSVGLEPSDYNKGSIPYTDPYAPSFHPLPGDGAVVMDRRDQTLVIKKDGSSNLGPGLIPRNSNWKVTDTVVLNMDDEARDELAIGYVNTVNGRGSVRIFRKDGNGQFQQLLQRDFDRANTTHLHLHLSKTQVSETRHRLEISALYRERFAAQRTITELTFINYDGTSFVNGGSDLVNATSNTSEFRYYSVDLNRDGVRERLELPIEGVSGASGTGTLTVWNRGRTQLLGTISSVGDVDVGQMDTDGRPEIATFEVVTYNSTSGLRAELNEYEMRNGRIALQSRRSAGGGGFGTAPNDRRFHIRLVDFDGDGVDTMFYHHSSFSLPGGDAFSSQVSLPHILDMDVANDNVNGRERLMLLTSNPIGGQIQAQRLKATFSNGFPSGYALDQVTNQGSTSTHIVSGDVDARSFKLRYTGNKWTSLGDPVIIAVLAAAPTWSEARVPSQNRAGSSTSFSQSTSTSVTSSVARTYSVSASAGLEGKLLGVFEVEAKATITGSLEQLRANSSTLTEETVYTGGATEDTIVFVGTLYRNYEYEIISAPDSALVGTTMTIDDPVASRTFKWELNYYNRNMEPRHQVFPVHTIGDPLSYRTESQANNRLRNLRGWRSTVMEGVGQGSGANTKVIALDNSNSTSTTRSIGIGAEVEVKAGGKSMGASFSVEQSWMHEVSFSKGTGFTGTVGDIRDGAQYTANDYAFGLLILQQGVRADGSRKAGEWPYYLITYFTEDLTQS